MTNDVTLKLRPDIEIARHSKDVVVLVGELTRQPVRLTGVSSQLVDLFAAGCSRQDLCDYLKNLGYPEQEAVATIDPFLTRLFSAHILQPRADAHTEDEDSKERWKVNIDPFAHFLARPFLSLPFWLTGSLGCVGLLLAFLLIATALFKGLLLVSNGGLLSISLWGLLGMIPYVILHELSHAIACRAVGCRVSGLGIRFPSAYVDTRYVVLLKNRWAKAWVALAGPYMDVILLGLISLLILLSPSDSNTVPSLRLLFIGISTWLFFNLNPWRISDGSNAVGALVDDPFVLKNSLSIKGDRKKSSPYFYYRLWAFSYVLFFLIALTYYGWILFHGLGKPLR